MASVVQTGAVSKGALWTGRVLSGLIVALMVMSGVMKLMMTQDAQKDLDPIGWSVGIMGTIGVIEITCAILYAIPQTAVLGAILLAGYLGGACATSVRVGQYGFSLAPVILGVVAWVALYLRDARVRSLAPIRAL
ncbi:MAG TPA: DoxX family protein [Lacipirellulaceae bacterium]|jgi:hypothetical protein|nr:DoxX family protein [Lacipirellulaceae bacterium]